MGYANICTRKSRRINLINEGKLASQTSPSILFSFSAHFSRFLLHQHHAMIAWFLVHQGLETTSCTLPCVFMFSESRREEKLPKNDFPLRNFFIVSIKLVFWQGHVANDAVLLLASSCSSRSGRAAPTNQNRQNLWNIGFPLRLKVR